MGSGKGLIMDVQRTSLKARRPGIPFVMVALGFVAGACKSATDAAPASLNVAAAADLAFAFKEVGAAFERATGQNVTFSFGSTGLLARQIIEGAPFDLFAAANVSFAEDVVKAGNCLQDSLTLYARGRIVAWWSKTSSSAPPEALADLAMPAFTKIAIANPEHAPYGRAAQQALAKAGVWEAVKSKLVYGENVQQTMQFAQTGNVDVAIVALSLATVATEGDFFLIADDQHDAIDQALVVCGKGLRADLARRFAGFVNSEEGREIMRRYGFLLPGEPAASGC
jgi:molybdate transport system substrate-binding protein